MNKTNLNFNCNDTKNLPLKAYFLNKYEILKEPETLNLCRNQVDLEKILLNPIDKSDNLNRSSSLFYETVDSTMGKLQAQKSTLSNDNKEYNIMYGNKPLSIQSDTFNKDINLKANQANNRMHFSGSNSSIINSDEEEDYGETVDNSGMHDGDTTARNREERRRISHTHAEQRRRNAIKRGYDDLQFIVPSCDFMDPSSSQKVCKATVLKRCYELIQNLVPSCQQTDPIVSMRITRAITLEQTIDYIHEMEKEKDNHEKELDSLKKEVTALKIMNSNYEEILQFHRNQPKDNSMEISNDVLFELFAKFADNLFQSFQSMVNANSFAEMTGSTLNWLEQKCTANNLKNLVLLSLYQVIK